MVPSKEHSGLSQCRKYPVLLVEALCAAQMTSEPETSTPVDGDEAPGGPISCVRENLDIKEPAPCSPDCHSMEPIDSMICVEILRCTGLQVSE